MDSCLSFVHLFMYNWAHMRIFIILFLFLSGCSTLTEQLLKDPEVKLESLKVTNKSLTDVSLALNFVVINPNPIPLKLDSIDYALQFSGSKVTAGTFEQGVQIPASGQGELTVPLTFEYKSLASIVDKFLKKTVSQNYELTGQAKLGIFSIPFSKSGEIQLRK